MPLAGTSRPVICRIIILSPSIFISWICTSFALANVAAIKRSGVDPLFSIVKYPLLIDWPGNVALTMGLIICKLPTLVCALIGATHNK